MAAQPFHDFKAFANRRAEMMRPADQVALVNVIRPDAHHRQLVQQFFHHADAVVNAAQQHRLVTQRNPGIREPRAGSPDLGGRLARVVGVDIDPHRVKLFQHRAQGRRDALRQKHRDPRTDPQQFNVRNLAQLPEQAFEPVIVEQQWIAAAEQHVAHFAMVSEVIQRRAEIGFEMVFPHPADHAAARAISAVRRAPVGHQKQHAVGIPVH